MKIKLTDEQMEQLKPMIDDVFEAFDAGKPVMLVGQIAIKASETDCMEVGIIPHAQALLFSKIRGYDLDMEKMYRTIQIE